MQVAHLLHRPLSGSIADSKQFHRLGIFRSLNELEDRDVS